MRPVTVQLGLTDGSLTEVVSCDLPPDTAVVVGENRGGGPSPEAGNPFAPPPRGREEAVRCREMELITLQDIRKTYHLGEQDVPVLKGVSTEIRRELRASR